MANNSSVAITVLLPSAGGREDHDVLRDLIAGLVESGEAVEEVVLEGPALVRVRVGGTRLTAVLRRGRLPRSDYADFRRPATVCNPAEDEGAVDRLAANDRCLVLGCGCDPGAEDEADRLFRSLLAGLAAREAEALFLLSRERLVLTAAEVGTYLKAAPAILPRGLAKPSAVRAPRRAAGRRAIARTRRPVVEHVPVTLPDPAAPVRIRRFVRLPPAPAPRLEEVANDRPDLPDLPRAELRRLRAALYPEEDGAVVLPAAATPANEADPTLAQRLSAVFMDLTLVIVALPVGAAVITHNVLRGRTDLKLSARAMALTGAALGIFSAGVPNLTGLI